MQMEQLSRQPPPETLCVTHYTSLRDGGPAFRWTANTKGRCPLSSRASPSWQVPGEKESPGTLARLYKKSFQGLASLNCSPVPARPRGPARAAASAFSLDSHRPKSAHQGLTEALFAKAVCWISTSRLVVQARHLLCFYRHPGTHAFRRVYYLSSIHMCD